ncbi:DEAD/DEAH box helicase [Mycolicibacterium iranicum]|uniref:Helicase associated domain protein n=1 Tax=Mycolicibacterium iranicum TaxID=912594 RepID=A0ABT4HMC9_MYCIR|nr:DEAD/DEAH box helicase [Mycolicibacterium iranicum]MCZ0730904.1 Helicase associated domain protein [Mycolicibacterium iranicum]
MGGFKDLRAGLDTDSQRRGTQFEHICQWYLNNNPKYASQLRHVWLWKEWPGRWSGTEAGIDLVAEDNDGRLWAIQCKAYAIGSSVTKRDVDKFLSESSRARFAYRLLIATTDQRHHIAKRLMDELGVGFIGLTQLEEADHYLRWPKSPTDLRPSKPPKPKRPFEYQRRAVSDVVQGFKHADRGQLIMACGTGKTLTAWFITQELGAERTLVLVPSLSLLKQTMHEWHIADPTTPFSALPVCSDSTVNRAKDAAISHTSDLGMPVTTDPNVIAAFLRKRTGRRVVFSTYQSSPQIAEAFGFGRVPAFDLIIADEAHRCAGPVGTDFTTVLDPQMIKGRRRLFMTATPRYFTGRILRVARDADYEIASMDDRAQFGGQFHRLNFSEAIDRKLLTDYQVAVIGVDDATYLDWAERGTVVTLDGERITDARALAAQIGLAKAMRKFDLRRVISFHNRVKSAREFAESMQPVLDWMPARHRPKGSLWSEHASSEMSASERAVLIQHLKDLDDGERGLLANARCLSEGVDVPALDGVAFIDPRRSEVDIVQAVGRAIRKSETKKLGTIVIPVFIDTAQDADVALDSSIFKPVWDVIKALRAHDTELGEHLDALRREIGRTGSKPNLPSKIHIDVPATVGKDFIDAFRVHVVDATTAPWEFWFGLLQRYVTEHGHTRLTALEKYNGLRLGQWVSQQRYHRNKGNLDPARARLLESFPDWLWDAVTDQWEEGFRSLQGYVRLHGDALVPQSFRSADNYRLGQWVTIQRTVFRDREMSQERQARLEALPKWSWAPRDSRWDSRYAELEDYVRANGRAQVPRADGQLAIWAQTQRSRYAKGTLRPDRVGRLEALPGWVWDPHEAAWETGFANLREYVKCAETSWVPDSVILDNGYRLGGWVNNQRTMYAKGLLPVEYQRRLEGLSGWMWTSQDQWEEGFRQLAVYIEKHGNALVPAKYTVGGYSLGSWVGTQRANYQRGTLRSERKARLADLDGWSWDPHADKWEDGFQRICDYVREYGDAMVPYGYVAADYQLGAWVLTQRGLRKKGKLEPERERRLDGLRGWKWDAADDSWEKKFSVLCEYVAREGHALVPQKHVENGVKLGQWITFLRHNRTLRNSAERTARLEALPGWSWNPEHDRWERAFQRLTQYVDQQGDADVPFGYVVEGFALGSWAYTLRRSRQKGTLDAERERRLDQLRGWKW